MNRQYSILSLLIFFILASCNKDKEEVFDPGYKYYPLEIGNYLIYDVQKISYSSIDIIEENYQIKEVLTENFTIGNESRQRLERYKRLSDTLPWPATPDSVWSISFSNSRLIKIENNTRFVKLAFPVANEKTWNGNVENDQGEDGYIFKDNAKPYTVLSQTYQNTVTVLQNPNDSNFVSKDYRVEVFAKDIGMIYKVKEIYEYDQGTFGQYNIASGIKYYERLSAYGKQ